LFPLSGIFDTGSAVEGSLERTMPIHLEDHLLRIEQKFWTQGPKFFDRNLAYAAIMVFPEPVGVLPRERILASLGRQERWTEVLFEDHRLLELSDRAALLTYKATARRGEGEPYVVHASSAYVRDGGSWKLAFHQQTPLALERVAEDV
jgi:hypothetical protein